MSCSSWSPSTVDLSRLGLLAQKKKRYRGKGINFDFESSESVRFFFSKGFTLLLKSYFNSACAVQYTSENLRLHFCYAFVTSTSIWNAQLTFKLGSSGLEPHWYTGSLLYYYSESQPYPFSFSFSFTSLLS